MGAAPPPPKCVDCGETDSEKLCQNKKRKSGLANLCKTCKRRRYVCVHGTWKHSCSLCSPQNFCVHGKANKYCSSCFPESVYKKYKENAKGRKLAFEISLEFFKQLVAQPCHLCGRKTYSMGVDRKNNRIGYTGKNSAPCCKACNFMKGTYGVQDYIVQCNRVTRYQEKIAGENDCNRYASRP